MLQFMGSQRVREIWVQFLGQEVILEREMATHSSIFAWRISWTEEPGGLQVMESQESVKFHIISLFRGIRHLKIVFLSFLGKKYLRMIPLNL